MSKKIRTRFAPSPTGYLHIGGLRTALFAFLTAKSQDGNFILRIEDTDQKRLVEGSAENLVKIFNWIGIKFDESPLKSGEYGPYIQSERQDIYEKYKNILLEKKEAYHCFCTPERLQKMRADQQKNKKPPRYDRACRDLSPEEVEKKIKAGEPYVIRQKMPLEGEVIVHDELRGDIKFKAEELDDHVLIKSNGIPTYQFAVVVDDHLMKITHVTRSEEWIPSFPKNVLLYKSFGWEVPKFIHFPVVLNKEGGKLSKRQGSVAVEDFRDLGYLKEALINFVSLLGWHPKGDNEILSLEDLIKQFNYKNINTSPAIFDIEKLDYFNGYYIRNIDLDKLTLMAKPYLEDNINLSSKAHKKTQEFLKSVLRIEKERLKKLSDIKELTKFLFVDNLNYGQELLIWKKNTLENTQDNLRKIINLLIKIPEENWTNDSLEDAIISWLKAQELKIGDYLWPMRVALSGKKASPGPFEIAEVLGKEETLERIKKAIN